MTTHTAASLTRLITKRIEPDHAEHVLRALRPFHGQLITSRLLDRLPGGRVEWRMRREMGRTVLLNRAHLQSKGDSPDALDLTLARSEASVPLNLAWFEKENSQYFAHRRERNAGRVEALEDCALLTDLATVMNNIVAISAQLAAEKQRFLTLAEDRRLYADRYELERACGLRDSR